VNTANTGVSNWSPKTTHVNLTARISDEGRHSAIRGAQAGLPETSLCIACTHTSFLITGMVQTRQHKCAHNVADLSTLSPASNSTTEEAGRTTSSNSTPYSKQSASNSSSAAETPSLCQMVPRWCEYRAFVLTTEKERTVLASKPRKQLIATNPHHGHI
jgi:hypothetical protein